MSKSPENIGTINLLGPGAYETIEYFRNNQKPARKWQIINNKRLPLPPTIPSHNNRYGYRADQNGDLVAIKPHIDNSSIIDEQIPLEKRYKGINWSKNKLKRLGASQLSNIGPGYYDVKIANYIRKKMIKLRKHTPTRERQECGSLLSGENTTANLNDYLHQAQSLNHKRNALPFGTQSNRFKPANSACSHLGPGLYSPYEKIIKRKQCTQRNDLKIEKEIVGSPGPGMYEHISISNIYRKISPSKCSAFGSSEKRFLIAEKKALGHSYNTTSDTLQTRQLNSDAHVQNDKRNYKYIGSVIEKFKKLKIKNKIEIELKDTINLPDIQKTAEIKPN